MKKKSNYRNVEVISSTSITPHLQRIVLGGKDLNDFPENEEGSYVKVIFEKDKSLIEKSNTRPKMKSYTVGHFDKGKNHLSLDFVVNMHEGPSTNWAKQAKAGDKLVLAGPGPRKIYNFPSTDYLLFCDLTSINAVRAYLNLVPEDATGRAVIYVPTQEDIIELPTRSKVSIEFITKDSDELYANAFRNYKQLSDKTIVFAAGEFHKVSSLQKLLRESEDINKNNVYISSYWKRGLDDKSFRDEKKNKTVST